MGSIDNTGHEILEVIADADQFNHWMYRTIAPFLSGSILEIGSGIGNISSFLIRDNHTVTLSDTDEYYITTLKKKFSTSKNLKGVFNIDLMDAAFIVSYAAHSGKYDTVFLLNVLEHIPDDSLAIKNCTTLLKPGGKLIVLTPAYPGLFAPLDQALGHYRRYRTRQLKKIFELNNLNIHKTFHFNAAGIPAWLYAKLRQLKTIPSGEMNLFNKLVPFSRIMDKMSFRKIGLSLIMIGIKKGNSI